VQKGVEKVQEYIEEKTVALVMRGTRVTSRMLAKAMRDFLVAAEKMASDVANPTKHGKQSYSSLTKDGDSLSNIEITKKNIGAFDKTARKYKINYALKKDKSVAPPRWLVFFKAKDADSLTAAFKEFSNKILKTKNRKPSILTKLNKFKELAKSVAAPARSRNRGGHEL
jgi:hypothetical protein